jgi:hypothetical protein
LKTQPGENSRRAGGRARTKIQTLVIGGNKQADDDDPSNVKEKNPGNVSTLALRATKALEGHIPNINALDGFWQIASGVLGLSRSDLRTVDMVRFNAPRKRTATISVPLNSMSESKVYGRMKSMHM